MSRASVFIGVVLLMMAPGFAQQPATNQNPNPNTPQNTYNQPQPYYPHYNTVVVRHGSGGWGLLGLIGLSGLLGLRRRETIVRSRDEYVDEQRRRVA
jgi:MYXO-CTERM domain-containing protein